MRLPEIFRLAQKFDAHAYPPELRDHIIQSIAENLGIEGRETNHAARVRIFAGWLFITFTGVTGVMALTASAGLLTLDKWPFTLCWAVFVGGMSKIAYDSLKR